MKGFQGPKDPSELHKGGLNPLGQRVSSWNPPNLETSGPSHYGPLSKENVVFKGKLFCFSILFTALFCYCKIE